MNLEAETNLKLGERIRKRRKLLGLTQKDIARHIGVSVQQVQKYEAGKNRISAVNLLAMESLIGAIGADYATSETHRERTAAANTRKTPTKLLGVISRLKETQQTALYKFVTEMLKRDPDND